MFADFMSEAVVQTSVSTNVSHSQPHHGGVTGVALSASALAPTDQDELLVYQEVISKEEARRALEEMYAILKRVLCYFEEGVVLL